MEIRRFRDGEIVVLGFFVGLWLGLGQTRGFSFQSKVLLIFSLICFLFQGFGNVFSCLFWGFRVVFISYVFCIVLFLLGGLEVFFWGWRERGFRYEFFGSFKVIRGCLGFIGGQRGRFLVEVGFGVLVVGVFFFLIVTFLFLRFFLGYIVFYIFFDFLVSFFFLFQQYFWYLVM